jgi:hypothetical protein
VRLRILTEHQIVTDGRHCETLDPPCSYFYLDDEYGKYCDLFEHYLAENFADDEQPGQFIRCQECLDAEAFTKRTVGRSE